MPKPPAASDALRQPFAISRRQLLLSSALIGVGGRLPWSPRAAAQQASPVAETCSPATTAGSEAIARAYFAAFNAGDVLALDALLDPDYVHAGALVAVQDRQIHLDRLLALHESFPDLTYDLEAIVAEDDLVAVRHTFSGTQTGDFLGNPPSGRAVAIGGMHLHQIACGKIAQTWNAGDAYGLYQQLGLLPGPVLAVTGTPLAAAATPHMECPVDQAAANRDIAARWFADAVNPRQLERLADILTPDAVLHATAFPDAAGPVAIADVFDRLYTGFSDLNFAVLAGPAQHGLVVEYWTATGTHDGEFQGAAASGATVTWSGMNFYRIACGRIAEIWTEADTLGRARQLGLVPTGSPAATPAR